MALSNIWLLIRVKWTGWKLYKINLSFFNFPLKKKSLYCTPACRMWESAEIKKVSRVLRHNLALYFIVWPNIWGSKSGAQTLGARTVNNNWLSKTPRPAELSLDLPETGSRLPYKNLDVSLFWGYKSHVEPDVLGHRFLQQHSCLLTHARDCALAFSHQRPAEMLTGKKGCPQCLSTLMSYVRCSAFLNVLLRLLQTYKVLMLMGFRNAARTPLWHIDHFWAGGLEQPADRRAVWPPIYYLKAGQ